MLAWWDRRTFANHADPKQLSAFFAEQKIMAVRPGTTNDLAVAAGKTR
jgi:hypothetical protein